MQRLAYQQSTSWANAFLRCVNGGYLADTAAADTRKDGSPAIITQAVFLEVEATLANGRQRAIDAQSVRDCCDALHSVGAIAIIIYAANLVAGKIQLRAMHHARQ